MTLRLYNSLTRKKENLDPIVVGKIGMYVCGPTVYDRAHIGNARPNVVFDTLYRLLRLNHIVTYVQNITDIDDKIINAANARGTSIESITEETIKWFHSDMDALGVLRPTHQPRATQYVAEMIRLVSILMEKGYAYAADGHVLFEVGKQKDYGCLSRCMAEEMLAGARVEVAPWKRNPADFVLWKPSTDDMPGWESPWGRGRPGWHIECSAMSLGLLGESFDIHAGGQDLMFPHHENEIAQSTAAFGSGTFARMWLHNGILLVNGEKMSKSLGNFITVGDLLAKADGETIRLAILSTHYRQPLDWTDDLITNARNNLNRFYTAIRDFPATIENTGTEIDRGMLECLNDDLNTPAAIGRLHEMVKEINTEQDLEKKRLLQATFQKSASVLGLLEKNPENWFRRPTGDDDISPDEIESEIHARAEARKNRDFAGADTIRLRLLQKGIALEDTPHGTLWRRENPGK